MPRHPPCALHSLSHKHNTTTTTTKTRTDTHTPDHPPPPKDEGRPSGALTASVQDARVHYADLKQQTHQYHPHTHPRAGAARRPEDSDHRTHPRDSPQAERASGSILQDPTVCLTPTPPATAPGSTPHPPPKSRTRTVLTSTTRTRAVLIVDDSTSEHHQCTNASTILDGRQVWRYVLLRKEVIQPHLPVRLPCYDFVPIASPTFDGSLPQGLGHRLRVLPTFVT